MNDHQTYPLSRPKQNQRALRYRFYLRAIAFDLVVLFSSFVIASTIRLGTYFVNEWLTLASFVSLFFIVSAFSWGAYTIEAVATARKGVKRSAIALLSAYAILFLTFYLFKVGPDYSRAVSLLSLLLALTLMTAARLLHSEYILRRHGSALIRNVYIRDATLKKSSVLQSDVDWIEASCPSAERLDEQLRFSTVIDGADRVIVACDRKRAECWSETLRHNGVQGELFLPGYDGIAPIGVNTFHGQSTLVVAAAPLTASQRALKRVFDLSVAVVLILTLSPLLLVTALMIKATSPGPVLFNQTRLGRGNMPFVIFKFRTMKAADGDVDGKKSTMRDDARITRFGSFLRKTSIDELPQLFNVLKGQMSIVGPRPHAMGSTAEDKLFWEVDQTYWRRHALKPGITGLAQIKGYRGATETEEHLKGRVRTDLEYLQDWSIFKDISITLQTALVLVHKNAY